MTLFPENCLKQANSKIIKLYTVMGSPSYWVTSNENTFNYA